MNSLIQFLTTKTFGARELIYTAAKKALESGLTLKDLTAENLEPKIKKAEKSLPHSAVEEGKKKSTKWQQ